MLPEFIMSSEGSWLGLSVYSERSTHTSSMQPATCGKRFVISIPLCPCGLAGNGEGISLPRLRRPVATVAGGSCPEYRSSAGLGSNVSTCDGPPFMNRKITRFARAGKCGALAPSGSRATLLSSPSAPAARADPRATSIPAEESICAAQVHRTRRQFAQESPAARLAKANQPIRRSKPLAVNAGRSAASPDRSTSSREDSESN